MNTSKVIISFGRNRFSDAALVTKAHYIIQLMTENPAYPSPSPTIANVVKATDSYESALSNASSGAREAIVLKNNARTELETVLHQLAEYVQITSKGDEATILSGGFDVKKKPSPVGILDKPKSLTVKQGGNSGSVELVSSIVPHAQFYIFEYTPAPVTPDSVWESVVHTKHALLLEGLEGLREYAFRVAGGGTSNVRIWSDTVHWNVG
jgi:hypothetical protein